MSHDISQPVPQGGDGTQDTENSRIAAIANELERLCAVHEAQLGDSQADVNRFETEQRAAEQMAKANGYWISMMNVFDLGVPGPSGNDATHSASVSAFQHGSAFLIAQSGEATFLFACD